MTRKAWWSFSQLRDEFPQHIEGRQDAGAVRCGLPGEIGAGTGGGPP